MQPFKKILHPKKTGKIKNMRKILLTSIAIFALLSANAQTHHFKFKVENKSELNELTRIISIDNYKDGFVWAYANDSEFEKFSKFNYKIEELPLRDNSAKVINMATTVAAMSNWDKYPTYEVYIEMMNKFATDYPDICKTVSIGTSKNGREILALKISDNVDINEEEPEFFYTSSIHGDETTGFVLLLRLADSLLSNYVVSKDVNNIVNNFELFINPAANPDGTYYGGNSTVSSAQRYNANGIDLNRNFPDPRAGQNPDGNSHQPETIAMMNFAGEHNFIMSANFHGGEEVLNYPWDTWSSSQNINPDDNWFYQTNVDYVNTSRVIKPDYYTHLISTGVTEGGDWYVITGGRQDYMNYWHHCKEITIEISLTKLLSSDLLKNYWNYNKQSLLDYIEESGFGFGGTVTNSEGQAVDAKIEIIGHDKDNSWVKTDPIVGDYHRPIAPGSYDVTYSALGYLSQTKTVYVSDWKTLTIRNIILETDTGISSENKQEISIIPNPFNEYTTFNFYLENESSVSISLFSYIGKQINIRSYSNLPSGNQTIKWEISKEMPEIVPGIYFYKIQTDTNSFTGKIIYTK